MTNEVINDGDKRQSPEFIDHVNRINRIIDTVREIEKHEEKHGPSESSRTELARVEQSLDLAYLAIEIQLFRGTLEGVGMMLKEHLEKPPSRIIT